MTSRDFCYWLQGFLELSPETDLNTRQVKVLQAHLSLVFKHEIDPSYGDDTLNKLHDLPYPPDGGKMRCVLFWERS